MKRTWTAILSASGVGLAAVIPAVAPASAATLAPPQVRVNQVGYPSAGPKTAYAMLPRKVASVRFQVVTPYGVVYQGTSTRDVGSWNAAYQAVYQLSFSGLHQPGQYRVRLVSPAAAVSPGFIVGDGPQLYRQLVDNSVRYFTSERDGPDVDSSVMDRQPANLTDEKAYVYADPRYDSNDNLLGTLKKTGGPVDVSGGWFDAGGGYEKFAYTASYADALMLLAARNYPNSYEDLATAARWARAYIAQGHDDTFNLYDTGAVAEAELIQAMRQAGAFPIPPATLLADMAAQLRAGEAQSKGDPFALGSQLGNSDASPHAFGLFITDALYRKYGGSDPWSRFTSFAQQQLNFALGANGWGTSFVVGAGTVFPHCMQSEIANLAGSLTGRGDIQLGATTDGPSSPDNFVGLGTVDGMRACGAGHFAPFNTKTASYEDNVVSWPSVEPADDYTANSLLAFALGADQGSGLG